VKVDQENDVIFSAIAAWFGKATNATNAAKTNLITSVTILTISTTTLLAYSLNKH